ncbi:urease accessory protein [Humitalea rosea]|uniref:Urease accessory protein UreD n=1 Tax=Humitalea rosea TaxID=990373 RepID=A0A2W7KJK2_9PROT|nr:urease accessory protein UreD [Humitalea rosea]PZW48126.1 urease accessory protein [Humitalea rosea]
MLPSPARHQRADGGVLARFTAAPRGAAPASLYQTAPLRLLLPDPEPDEVTTAALLNTGGGLAGGDAVRIGLDLAAGARLTVATAAAEKIYRSLGPPTRIAVELTLEPGAALEWIPQETILFDGASLARATTLRLAPGSRLLAAETLVFGRAARKETVTTLNLHDAWRLHLGDRLIWADALRLRDGAALADRFRFGAAGALATLLCVGPDPLALLAVLRGALAGPARADATQPAPGVLLARILGDATAVRATVAAAILAVRAPLLGLPSRLPRLWTT